MAPCGCVGSTENDQKIENVYTCAIGCMGKHWNYRPGGKNVSAIEDGSTLELQAGVVYEVYERICGMLVKGVWI